SVLGSTGEFAGAAAMGLDIVLVERRGVDRSGRVDAAAATQFATKSCRVADELRVIDEYLTVHPGRTPAILLGASEGGAVCAAVPGRESRLTHLISMGPGGGWTQAEELRYFVRSRGDYLGLHGESDLDRALDDIRSHPDADTMWLGHPYRRWSSFAFDRPGDD